MQPDPPTIQLTINGVPYTVNPDTEITPATSLAAFLRTKTSLRGTKVSCHEGGCGACTVALTYIDPRVNQTVTRAVNACLRPLFSCNGMAVTTVEGIGGSGLPYHPIQQRLADGSGTQCGYCSPGMVMAMYSLLSKNPNPTALDIERELDGNLCRCTGYRPILEAFKTFAVSNEPHCKKDGCQRKGLFRDIEEVLPMHHRTDLPTYVHPAPSTTREKPRRQHVALITSSSSEVWHDLETEQDICYWLPHYASSGKSVMLVGGRTSLGVYPTQTCDVMLNIALVSSLRSITQDPITGITMGAMVTISDAIDYLSSIPPSIAAAHVPQVVAHLSRVAGHAIRNTASIAGNLILAQQNVFPSDVCVVLMGLGAMLRVVTAATSAKTDMDVTTFLASASMFPGKCYLQSIIIPWALPNEVFMSYKMAIRQVNAHAVVNAAMRVTIDPVTHRIKTQPTIAYGGIFATQTRLTGLETSMVGFQVTDNYAFQNFCTQLHTEIVPDPSQRRVKYRKNLALTFFYKFFLSLQPGAPPLAPSWMIRPVTTASQAFQPNPAEYPVSKGIPKLEGIAQTSGEAVYTDDMPEPSGCRHAALVLAPSGNCTIDPKTIDISFAKQLPGFLAFYCALDVPVNANANAVPQGEVFCSGKVMYAGQIVGVVVASTAAAAAMCAAAVVVPCTNINPSLLTASDAVAANSYFDKSIWPAIPPVGDVAAGFAASQHVVSDTVTIGGQQHFHMENHVALVVPNDIGGLSLQVATQAPALIQEIVAGFLGMSQASIEVATKRCGGGFGGKGGNSMFPSAIASLCAVKCGCPVKLLVDLQTTMSALGGREDYYIQYKVGFNTNGTILAVEATCNANAGCSPNGGVGGSAGSSMVFIMSLDNCYNIPNWSLTSPVCMTNTPAFTSTRGPGWISAIYTMERIIARVASELALPLDTVRLANFYKRGDMTPIGMPLKYWNMDVIYTQLQASANYVSRVADVANFNAANKWVKRGIGMQPSRFAVSQHMPMSGKFGCHVSIYPDGTVTVTHGGVEIGQGVNTKVAQVTAYALGIDVGLVRIGQNTTTVCPDASNLTGSSTTSELCSLAVIDACSRITARIAPFRVNGTVSWAAAIAAASAQGVSLSEQGWTKPLVTPAASNLWDYNSYSAVVSEVELDVLTGQYQIVRTDILFDCGISVNPVVDIGQVEGGFMFGVGYFLQEEIVRDPSTGKNLTAGTWEYKPPSAYDLPETFNVTLLRDAPNPRGVLSSKACGEPPLALATSVVQALEEAVSAARATLGVSGKRWVTPVAPLTVDVIQTACGVTQRMLTLP